MSSESTRVTEQHFDYVRAHTAPEPELLADLKVAARAAGIPEIWISTEQASFMQILLRVAGAREVVEVGTLAGYSAIVMAMALPADGLVRTVELEPLHASFAETWIARSPAAGRVEVHLGDGRSVLPQFADGSADAAFIDADKEGYPFYLQECLRIVRPGGLIMADNAFAFGHLFTTGEVEPSVHHIRAFNEQVAACGDLQAVIVPIGDGCWVGVRQ